MLATILTYIVIIFAIIGLTYSIEAFWLYIIRPKNPPKRATIINLKKDMAKMQILEILEERNWRGEKQFGDIILTNLDLEFSEFLKLKKEFKDKELIFLEKTEMQNWRP